MLRGYEPKKTCELKLHFRLSAEQFRRIKEKAAQAEMSINELARLLLLKSKFKIEATIV